MAFVEKELAQKQGSVSDASVYSPPTGVRAIIKVVTLCNTSAVDTTFRIFKDNNGTTYDKTTALLYDVELKGNKTLEIDTFWPMANSNGNLAFSTPAGTGITITLHGAEITNN